MNNYYQYISNYKEIIRSSSSCVIWKIVDYTSIFKKNKLGYTSSGIPYIQLYKGYNNSDSINLTADLYVNGKKVYSSDKKIEISANTEDNKIIKTLNDLNDFVLLNQITPTTYVTDIMILIDVMPKIKEIVYDESIIYDNDLKCNVLYLNEETKKINVNVVFEDDTVLNLFEELNMSLISSNKTVCTVNGDILTNQLFNTNEIGYSFISLNISNDIFENIPNKIKVICSSSNKTIEELINYKYIENKLIVKLNHSSNNNYNIETYDLSNRYTLVAINNRYYTFKLYSRLIGLENSNERDITTLITNIEEKPINEDNCKLTITYNNKKIAFKKDLNNNLILGNTSIKISLSDAISKDDYTDIISNNDNSDNYIYIDLAIDKEIQDVKWEINSDEHNDYIDDNNKNIHERIININRFLSKEESIDEEIISPYSEEDDENYIENEDKTNYTDDNGIININDNYQIRIKGELYKKYILQDENDVEYESDEILITAFEKNGSFNISNVKVKNYNDLTQLQYIYGTISENDSLEKYIYSKFKKSKIYIEDNTNYFVRVYVTLDNTNDTRIKISKQVFFNLKNDKVNEEAYSVSKLMKWNVNIDEMLITNFDYPIIFKQEIINEIDTTDYSDYPFIKVSRKYTNEQDYTDISDECTFEYDKSLIQLIKSNTEDNVWYIKPLKPGECDIELLNKFILIEPSSDSNCTETFHIIIRKVIEYINFDNYALEMKIGDKVNIKANYYPIDATYPHLVWFSNNDDIATISNSNIKNTGVITGVSEGTTYIGLNYEDTKDYLPEFLGTTDENGSVLINDYTLSIYQTIKCYVKQNDTIRQTLYDTNELPISNCLVQSFLVKPEKEKNRLYIKLNDLNLTNIINDINAYEFDDNLNDLFQNENDKFTLNKEFKIIVRITPQDNNINNVFETLTLSDNNIYKKTVMVDNEIIFDLLNDEQENIEIYDKNDDSETYLPQEINVHSDFSNIWKYCVVKVNPIPLTGVSFEKKSILCDIGKPDKLEIEYNYIKVSPENATYKNIEIILEKNKDENGKKVVNIKIQKDENGLPYVEIDPIRIGTAILKVYSTDYEDISDICKINVVDTTLQSITISGGLKDDDYEWYDDDERIRTIERFADEDFPRYKLAVNNSVQLKAHLHPSNTVNKGVKWYSSNPDLVKCTEDGICTAVRLSSKQELELYAEDDQNLSEDEDNEISDRYANTCWITCVSTDANVSAICQIRVFRNNITKIEIDADTITSTDEDFISDKYSYKRYDNTKDIRDDYYNYIMKVGEEIYLPVNFIGQTTEFGVSNNIKWYGDHGWKNGLSMYNAYIDHDNAIDANFNWKLKNPNSINDDKKEIFTKIKANLIGDYNLYCKATGKSGTLNKDKHDGEYYSYGFPEEAVLDRNGEIKFEKHNLKIKLLYKGYLYEVGTTADMNNKLPDINNMVDINGIPAYYYHNIITKCYNEIIIKYNTKQLKDRIKEIVNKFSVERLYKTSNLSDQITAKLEEMKSRITDESTEEEINEINESINQYLAEIQENFSNNLISNVYQTIDEMFDNNNYSYPLSETEKGMIKDAILYYFPEYSENNENDEDVNYREILSKDLDYLFSTNIEQLSSQDKINIQNKLLSILYNNRHSNPILDPSLHDENLKHQTSDFVNIHPLCKPFMDNEKDQIYKCLDEEIFYGYGLPMGGEEKLEVYNKFLDNTYTNKLPLTQYYQNKINDLWQLISRFIKGDFGANDTLYGYDAIGLKQGNNVTYYDITSNLGAPTPPPNTPNSPEHNIFTATTINDNSICSQFLDLFRPIESVLSYIGDDSFASFEIQLAKDIIDTNNFRVLRKHNIYIADINGKSLLSKIHMHTYDLDKSYTADDDTYNDDSIEDPIIRIEILKDSEIGLDDKFIILITDEYSQGRRLANIEVVDYRGDETTTLIYRTNIYGYFTYIPFNRPTYRNVYKLWNDTLYIINSNILQICGIDEIPDEVNDNKMQRFYDSYFNIIRLKIFEMYKTVNDYCKNIWQNNIQNEVNVMCQMICECVSNYKSILKKREVIYEDLPAIVSRIDANNIIDLYLPYQHSYSKIISINVKDDSIINEWLMYDKRYVTVNRYKPIDDYNNKAGMFEIYITDLDDNPVNGYVINVHNKRYLDINNSKIMDYEQYGKVNKHGLLTSPIKDANIVGGYEFNYKAKPTEHPGCGVWREAPESNIVRIRVIAEDDNPQIVIISGYKYIMNTNRLPKCSTLGQHLISEGTQLRYIFNELKIDYSGNRRILLALSHSDKFLNLLKESEDNYSNSKLLQKWDSYAWFTSNPEVFTLEEIQPNEILDPENSNFYPSNTFVGEYYEGDNNLWNSGVLSENYFPPSRMIAIVPQGPGTATLTCKSVMGNTYISKKITIV